MQHNVSDQEAAILRRNIETLGKRTELAVKELCKLSGRTPEWEIRRFRYCQERLCRARSKPMADPLAGVVQQVSYNLPPLFELVLGFRGEGLAGFSYLTQGKAGSSLPDSLELLIRGAFDVQRKGGARPDEPRLLADLFHASFPSLAALEQYSPAAQAMLFAVTPVGESLRTKAYFNTRLAPTDSHRARVGSMLAQLGLLDSIPFERVYDAMYADEPAARFHGVGVDFDGDDSRRAKIYVHLPHERIGAVSERVGALIGLSDAQRQQVQTRSEAVLASFEPEALVAHAELGLALCDDASPTLKLTLFFGEAERHGAQAEALGRLLRASGYSSFALERMLEVLTSDVGAGVVRKHVLNAVGIEMPDAEPPKINVYVYPML